MAASDTLDSLGVVSRSSPPRRHVMPSSDSAPTIRSTAPSLPVYHIQYVAPTFTTSTYEMPPASAGKEGVTTAPCFVHAIPSVEVAYAMLDAPPPQQAPYQILYSPPSKRTLPGTTPDASTSPPVPRGSTTPWRAGKTGGSVTAPRTYRIPEEAPTFEASPKSSRKSTASPRASVGTPTTHTTARTIPSPTRPFTRAEWEGGRKSLRSRPPMGTDVGAEASGDTCAAPTLNGGGDTRAVFRPWRSFPTMVLAGLIVGVALGDRLVFATQIATVALIVAMTLALHD